MDELYNLSEIFYNINSKIKAMIYILSQVESQAEDKDEEDIYILVSGIKYYLACLETEMLDAVQRLDLYEINVRKHMLTK